MYVRYTPRISGDCGEIGAPFTATLQASVHAASAYHILSVIVLAMFGLKTLELQVSALSAVRIARRFLTVYRIYWCLRIVCGYLIH